MEWVLQVVDEIDDAVSSIRLWCLGFHAEVGLSVAAGIGTFAIGAALWAGQEALLILTATLVLGAAAALKIHGAQFSVSR
jgi:hypothetical protein